MRKCPGGHGARLFVDAVTLLRVSRCVGIAFCSLRAKLFRFALPFLLFLFVADIQHLGLLGLLGLRLLALLRLGLDIDVDDCLFDSFLAFRYCIFDFESFHHFVGKALDSRLISVARRFNNLLGEVVGRLDGCLVFNANMLIYLLGEICALAYALVLFVKRAIARFVDRGHWSLVLAFLAAFHNRGFFLVI